ncbi:MAG: hypothetical protein QW187_04575 [Candidatus Korarchaeum sp.]
MTCLREGPEVDGGIGGEDERTEAGEICSEGWRNSKLRFEDEIEDLREPNELSMGS